MLLASLPAICLVYLCVNVGPQGLLVVGLPAPLFPHFTSASLRPSYWSGCMFLFYLLGVGLPCHWIFCQFWLCEEVQFVYLRRHLGSRYPYY